MGAVAEQVYDPSACVVAVTMFVLQLKTHTIVSPPTPPPFAVSVPETVNDVPPETELGVAEAVKDVETGFDRDPVLRFRVIEPGPETVTTVGSLESKHDNPPEQVQLANV